jgi:hypothetical protein
VKNLQKVFCKTLGKGFSPKTLKGFPENLYGFFTLCKKTNRRGLVYVLVKNP